MCVMELRQSVYGAVASDAWKYDDSGLRGSVRGVVVTGGSRGMSRLS